MTALAALAPTVRGVPAHTVTVADLPSVALDRLRDQAALQTRVDRKYVLSADELAVVLGRVQGPMGVLTIDGHRSFAYRSTYFDTPELDAFHLSGRGRRRRFKVRTRIYRQSGETWLEVKTRGPRGTTVKDRCGYDLADAGRLTEAGREFVAAVLAERRVEDVDVAALVPSLLTAYNRSTLLLGDDEQTSRATIDDGLSWRRPGASHSVCVPGSLILETKTGSRAAALDRALWGHGVRPSRISKYGAGLAALDDDLPDLKWHRVLTQLPTGRRSFPDRPDTEGLSR
jgi:VTC domain-containing protein